MIRRIVAALACTVFVGLVAAGPTGAAATTRAPAQTDTGAGVTMSGVSQTAWVTREGTWNLELAVDRAPAGAVLTATIHGKVADWSEYAASIYGVIDTEELVTTPELPLDEAELRADGSRSVPLAVTLLATRPADAAPSWRFLEDGLRPGVYPVDIRVTDADGEELGRLVVHLNRVPSDDEEGADDDPLLVAPLVDLGSAPTIGPEGDAEEEPVIAQQVDDLLAGVRMPGDLPLTVVPRPESIEALAREDDSEEVLDDLRATLRSRQVVDGPYVEVPLMSWIDRGLTEELTRQRTRGNSVLTEHLGRVDSSTWDARDGLTTTAAAALWTVGVRTVILDPGALSGGTETGGSVTAPVTIAAGDDRTMEAVVPDQALTDALGRYEDPVLDAAGLAAQLSLTAASTDGQQGVVLALPDEWLADPSAMAITGQVLLDPAAPVQPVTVTELLDAVPSTGRRDLAPTMPTDLGDYPDRLGLARARLSSFTAMVGPDTPEVGSLDQLLLLSGSAALDQDERSAYVETVLARTDRRFDAVSGDSSQTVTLTSSDGGIPLTLQNDLDVPVTVSIDVQANSRVEIRDFDSTQELEPGRNTLEIPVHTRAPGDSTLNITVSTTDGEVALEKVDYTVRSTAVPGIGIVLSTGAVAFLLVWWARHWLRDRRARREGDDGGGGGGGGGEPPTPDEPGPDDPAEAAPGEPALAGT